MKKIMMFAFVLSLTIILAACGAGSDGKKKDEKGADESTEQTDNEEVEISDDEKVDEDKVVVNINGSEIKGNTYNLIYAQRKMQLHQFGQDVSDMKVLKDDAMEALISQELLKQDADKLGIDVSKDEIESEFKSIKSENKDEFAAFLKQFSLSETTFKDQLSFALMHDKYLAEELAPIEVTEEEIKATYTELKLQNEEMPELKDIEEQLKMELTQQKEQEKLQEKVDELKEKAKIETKI